MTIADFVALKGPAQARNRRESIDDDILNSQVPDLAARPKTTEKADMIHIRQIDHCIENHPAISVKQPTEGFAGTSNRIQSQAGQIQIGHQTDMLIENGGIQTQGRKFLDRTDLIWIGRGSLSG